MEYPSLNQYIEAIQYPESFDCAELQTLRPVKMGRRVVMSRGNYAVVFLPVTEFFLSTATM